MSHFTKSFTRYFCIVLVISFAFSIKWASATSYQRVPWQEQALQADFVGVVECTKAGGIVAEFKIIDSWKGISENEHIMISMAADSYGPQFPIALCGEQFVVMAHKNDLSTKLRMSNVIPLWWRDIPFDYYLFYGEQWQVRDGNIRDYLEGDIDLKSFKQKIAGFLGADPREQELELLRENCKISLFGEFGLKFGDGDSGKSAQYLADLDEWKKAVQGAATLEETIKLLLNPKESLLIKKAYYPNSLKKVAKSLINLENPIVAKTELPQGVRIALTYAAHEHILNILKEMKTQGDFSRPDLLAEIIMQIEYRLNSSDEWKKEIKSISVLSDGTVVDLDSIDDAIVEKAKKHLAEQKVVEESVIPEYAILCEHDPEFILEYLKKWAPPDGSIRFKNAEYALASYFCWKSSGDRIKNLTDLLDSDNGYKKVAAATYLSFEDAELGVKHLSEFSELEGDPGVWAALNMLRRGDNKYMLKALSVFDTPYNHTMATTNHDNLQKRLLVLISNSCKKSGIPMPELKIADENKPNVTKEEIHQHNMTWWESVKDKITLYDPWFNELAKQKID